MIDIVKSVDYFLKATCPVREKNYFLPAYIFSLKFW
jgi:hypothetical protein